MSPYDIFILQLVRHLNLGAIFNWDTMLARLLTDISKMYEHYKRYLTRRTTAAQPKAHFVCDDDWLRDSGVQVKYDSKKRKVVATTVNGYSGPPYLLGLCDAVKL